MKSLRQPRLDFRLPKADKTPMVDAKKPKKKSKKKKAPERNGQVVRILKIIHMLELEPRGMTATQINEQVAREGYKCVLRTTYNDLDAISQAYMHITQEGEGENSRWKLDSIASLSRNIKFSYEELQALYLSKEFLSGLKQTPLWQPICKLFEKMELAFGPKALEELAELRNHLQIKPSVTWQTSVSQDILDTIHHACAEGHILEFDYKPSGGAVSHRRVAPLALYFADSSVYLVAKDYKDGIHKKFALSRLLAPVMTDEAHDEKEFDLDAFLKGSLGVLGSGPTTTVEIVFQEPIASYISDRRWHETQNLRRLEDGLHLTMTVAANAELARWVLSFGPHAKVLHPQSLAEQVQALASSVSQLYLLKKSA